MRRLFTTPIAATLLSLAGLGGCQSEATPAEPAAAPAAPAPAAAPKPEAKPEPEAKPKEEAKAVVTDPTFELRIDPAGKYVAGELARVDIALEPRGGYHINQEYPMSIELTGPEAVAIPKAKFGIKDAAKFDENRALFEMPLTPSGQGEHRVEAKVKFAVCTPETCVPDQRTLALALRVE